jgi:tRNA threonylcarbamoyladenosine biosynthesis protein TsaB
MLLAFDTSERNATVGVYKDERPLAELDSAKWLEQFEANEKIGSSTALVSIIRDAIEIAGVSPHQIAAIAFTNGPGTFTGIRVGLVAARMLAYAWQSPLVVVNSLEASAEKLSVERHLQPGTIVWSAINAQRRQVFAASYEIAPSGTLKPVNKMSLLKESELTDFLHAGDHVTGSGAKLFAESIEAKTGIELPAKHLACCDSKSVARLGMARLQRKEFTDIFDIEPIYFRPSAAEEVRIENALNLGGTDN